MNRWTKAKDKITRTRNARNIRKKISVSSKNKNTLENLYNERIDVLRKQIDELNEQLFWNIPPIKTDGIIELRRSIGDRNGIIGNYNICLYGEKKL